MLGKVSAKELVELFEWQFVDRANDIDQQNKMRAWRFPFVMFNHVLEDVRHAYGLENGTIKTARELEDEFLEQEYPDVLPDARSGVHKYNVAMGQGDDNQRVLAEFDARMAAFREQQLREEAERPARELAKKLRQEREEWLKNPLYLSELKRCRYRKAFTAIFYKRVSKEDQKDRDFCDYMDAVSDALNHAANAERRALGDGWDAAYLVSPKAAEEYLAAFVQEVKDLTAAAEDPSIPEIVFATRPNYEGCVALVEAIRRGQQSAFAPAGVTCSAAL